MNLNQALSLVKSDYVTVIAKDIKDITFKPYFIKWHFKHLLSRQVKAINVDNDKVMFSLVSDHDEN